MAQNAVKMLLKASILLTSLGGLIDARTIQHVSVPLPRLVERASTVIDGFTPHGNAFNWYAMGDSYTAGPGAGTLHPSNKGKCVRSNGSYGPQLSEDWLYEGDNDLTFLACTGDVTDDFINNQLPEMNSEPVPDLVIMTIGGNDIGFSKIAKACLIGLLGSGNCDDKIKDARDMFASDKFKKNLKTIYDGIFEQMNKDWHYQILHLGYPAFFNADDDSTWCNDQSLGKVGVSGLSPPKLTLELRRKMNQLSADFNTALWTNALAYANDAMNKPDRETAIKNGWLKQRLYFGSLDGGDAVYDGHRFCEPGVEDPKFGDPKTWIFGVWGKQKDVGPDDGNTAASDITEVGADAFTTTDASTCAQDPRYTDDDAFAWDCDMASYYADPSNDHTVTTITGFDFTRSFHPKTRGFTATKDFLKVEIPKMRHDIAVGTCVATGNMILYNGDDNDPSGSRAGVASVATPSAQPASVCATEAGNPTGFATALPPATSTAAAPAAAASCTFTGDPFTGGCQCSDGSTPARDEDNRCCVYNQPGGGSQCFNADGSGG